MLCDFIVDLFQSVLFSSDFCIKMLLFTILNAKYFSLK